MTTWTLFIWIFMTGTGPESNAITTVSGFKTFESCATAAKRIEKAAEGLTKEGHPRDQDNTLADIDICTDDGVAFDPEAVRIYRAENDK